MGDYIEKDTLDFMVELIKDTWSHSQRLELCVKVARSLAPQAQCDIAALLIDLLEEPHRTQFLCDVMDLEYKPTYSELEAMNEEEEDNLDG